LREEKKESAVIPLPIFLRSTSASGTRSCLRKKEREKKIRRCLAELGFGKGEGGPANRHSDLPSRSGWRKGEGERKREKPPPLVGPIKLCGKKLRIERRRRGRIGLSTC